MTDRHYHVFAPASKHCIVLKLSFILFIERMSVAIALKLYILVVRKCSVGTRVMPRLLVEKGNASIMLFLSCMFVCNSRILALQEKMLVHEICDLRTQHHLFPSNRREQL